MSKAGKASQERCRAVYADVRERVGRMLDDIGHLEFKDEEASRIVEGLRARLTETHHKFSESLDYVEKHSEWEKFTIAFFGETNAGKSTILEALRLLYDDPERNAEITDRQSVVDGEDSDLVDRTDQLVRELGELYERIDMHATDTAQELHALVEHQKLASKKLGRRLFISLLIAFLVGSLFGLVGGALLVHSVRDGKAQQVTTAPELP